MESFKQLLREHDLKITPARLGILDILHDSTSPMNAEEIYNEVSKETHTSLATIYRTLGQFSELGLLMQDNSSDGSIYYQFATDNHSHYLKCSNCNKRIHLENCPLSDLEERIQKETGFKITGHSLEFVGLCPECQKELQA